MLQSKSENWISTCRGIAVIGVLMTHLLPQINSAFNLNSNLIRAITVDIIDTGKIGVALLFLIAGYLTPTSIKKRNTKQFAVNRFFRLYPLYWLDILLVGIFFAFDGYGADTVLTNVTMLQVFFGKEDLVGLFWTLPIELLLYLGGVILKKCMWQFKKVFSIEIICSIGTIGIAFIRKYYWEQAPVAIGLLLTIALLGQILRLYKNNEVAQREAAGAVTVFAACLIISSVLAYQVDVGHQEHWWRYVLSYSIALAIFMWFLKTEKSIAVCDTIAIYAYPIYLLQEVVFRVAFEKVFYSGINVFLFVTGTLFALAIASVAAHILIEKPMAKIGSKVEIFCK